MPIDCDPTAIASASRCYCFPEKEYRGAVLYLLLNISGLNLTPEQLQSESKCFCMNEKTSDGAMLYLACNIANV